MLTISLKVVMAGLTSGGIYIQHDSLISTKAAFTALVVSLVRFSKVTNKGDCNGDV